MAISLSASSLTQEQILRLQVRHRTRTWRHGKWCGTCRTVIDWRGLRTVEASCSEWYPGVGTPIQTGGRNSKHWEGIWPSFSRTIWTDITWTSRVSHPNAPIEHSFRFKRNPFGNYFLFRRSSRPSRVDLHRYRLVDIWTMFAETTRSILLKSYSFMRCWHLIDNCTVAWCFCSCMRFLLTRSFYTLWPGNGKAVNYLSAYQAENLYTNRSLYHIGRDI